MQKGYEVVMDTREHGKTKELARTMGLGFQLEPLHTGDFALRYKAEKPWRFVAGIERKAIGDLVQSIQSQRIFDQIDRMYKHYPIAFLFISGDLAAHDKKLREMKLRLNDSVIYGTIASIIVRAGIHVCWFPDDRILLQAVSRTLSKISEGKYGSPIKRVPKYEEFSNVQVLMRVPGVTQEKAERLVNRFHTLEAIAAAKPKDLTIVDGIGPSAAQLIWRLFH